MNRIAIVIALLASACQEEEHFGPPPVGGSGPSQAVEPEPEPCTVYQECALGCSEVSWDDDPEYGQEVCLESCSVPEFVDVEVASKWGRSCVTLDDTDVCDDGYDLCLLLEENQ